MRAVGDAGLSGTLKVFGGVVGRVGLARVGEDASAAAEVREFWQLGGNASGECVDGLHRCLAQPAFV